MKGHNIILQLVFARLDFDYLQPPAILHCILIVGIHYWGGVRQVPERNLTVLGDC